jgi:hypothetical protein
MIMKQTIKELHDVWGAITSFENEKVPVKFAWAIAKNKKRIKPFLDELSPFSKKSDELVKFEKFRTDTYEKYAEKDENGKFKTEKDESGQLMYVISDEDKDKIEKEVKAYIDENEKIIEAAEKKRVDSYNEVLKKEVDMDYYQVPMSEVPNMTVKVLDLIMEKIVVE